MAYRIRLSDAAKKDIAALPAHVASRVARWLDLLAEDPLRAPTRKLQGSSGLRRVHASKDYVVLYSVSQAEVVVLVVRAGHRREIYRGL